MPLHSNDWQTLEWINDSACNVTFADAFSAKRALRSLGVKEAEPEDTPWFEAKNGRCLRLATEADVKPMFFDAQPPEERKLKEQKFGPALKKTAGKKERESKSARQVEMQVRSKVIPKKDAEEEVVAEEEHAEPAEEHAEPAEPVHVQEEEPLIDIEH